MGAAYLRARDGAAAVAALALEKRSRGDDGRRRRRTAAGSEGVAGRRARREGGEVAEEEKTREGERRANASIMYRYGRVKELISSQQLAIIVLVDEPHR
jgi:hypothetical protein